MIELWKQLRKDYELMSSKALIMEQMFEASDREKKHLILTCEEQLRYYSHTVNERDK